MYIRKKKNQLINKIPISFFVRTQLQTRVENTWCMTYRSNIFYVVSLVFYLSSFLPWQLCRMLRLPFLFEILLFVCNVKNVAHCEVMREIKWLMYFLIKFSATFFLVTKMFNILVIIIIMWHTSSSSLAHLPYLPYSIIRNHLMSSMAVIRNVTTPICT